MSDLQVFDAAKAAAKELFGNSQGDFAGTPLLDPNDDLIEQLVCWVYGYLLEEKSSLTKREKVLCVIAMSTVTNQLDMVKTWLTAAKNIGCSRREVQEAILTMAMYGGWPPARRALEVVEKHWPA